MEQDADHSKSDESAHKETDPASKEFYSISESKQEWHWLTKKHEGVKHERGRQAQENLGLDTWSENTPTNQTSMRQSFNLWNLLSRWNTMDTFVTGSSRV